MVRIELTRIFSANIQTIPSIQIQTHTTFHIKMHLHCSLIFTFQSRQHTKGGKSKTSYLHLGKPPSFEDQIWGKYQLNYIGRGGQQGWVASSVVHCCGRYLSHLGTIRCYAWLLMMALACVPTTTTRHCLATLFNLARWKNCMVPLSITRCID